MKGRTGNIAQKEISISELLADAESVFVEEDATSETTSDLDNKPTYQELKQSNVILKIALQNLSDSCKKLLGIDNTLFVILENFSHSLQEKADHVNQLTHENNELKQTNANLIILLWDLVKSTKELSEQHRALEAKFKAEIGKAQDERIKQIEERKKAEAFLSYAVTNVLVLLQDPFTKNVIDKMTSLKNSSQEIQSKLLAENNNNNEINRVVSAVNLFPKQKNAKRPLETDNLEDSLKVKITNSMMSQKK